MIDLTGDVVILADLDVGPAFIGKALEAPLSTAALDALTGALAPHNGGRRPGLWIIPACPIGHDAITLRAHTRGAG